MGIVRSRVLLFVLIFTPVLAGCARAAATPTPTATYDPCAPANVKNEVKKVNDLTREFDDGAQLAAVVKSDQLVGVIPSLQTVRRQAQDLAVPNCLAELKNLQLAYMTQYITTLLVLIQVGAGNPQVVVQGVNQANAFHNQYLAELARLIGATYVPPVTSTVVATQLPVSTP